VLRNPTADVLEELANRLPQILLKIKQEKMEIETANTRRCCLLFVFSLQFGWNRTSNISRVEQRDEPRIQLASSSDSKQAKESNQNQVETERATDQGNGSNSTETGGIPLIPAPLDIPADQPRIVYSISKNAPSLYDSKKYGNFWIISFPKNLLIDFETFFK